MERSLEPPADRPAHTKEAETDDDKLAAALARSLLKRLERNDRNGFFSGDAEHLTYVTIDGRFNLLSVARRVIGDLRRKGLM
jgi:hypothetical protein